MTLDLARARARQDQKAVFYDLEILSFVLLGLVRPGSPTEAMLVDLYLSVALHLAQQEDTLEPIGSILIVKQRQADPPTRTLSARV